MAPMRTLAAALVMVSLSACGGGGGDDAPDGALAASSGPSPAAASSGPPVDPADTPPDVALPPGEGSLEAEQQRVTDDTESAFDKDKEELSSERVTSNVQVKSLNEFRFDRASRTLLLEVSSDLPADDLRLPYSLATNLATVFWGGEAASSVRPEALPLLSVTVDGKEFRCDGPAMADLASRKLSGDDFVERCGT